MNSRRIVAKILGLFVLAAALTVAHATPVSFDFQVDGNQLTVNLHNPTSADVTVALTVFYQGQSLGTQVVTVPGGSSFGTVWTIVDDLNPFELSFSLEGQG